MGGQRNLIIIGAAVLLGLIAVLIANSYFSGVEERQAEIAQQQQLARIVVASQPLAFGTKLTSDNVRLQNWPATSVPEGAFRSIDAALRNNRVSLRPIVVGEPVLASKVSGTDGRATLAANLPEGMRAMSIPISNTSGVSGFVLPGTTVDVLLTRQIPGDGAEAQDQMVDVVMENVQVLAIDQTVDETSGKPKPGQTATLQTDLYGAQKLTLARKVGSLSLVLRNVENQAPAALTTVTVRDLPGGGIQRRARPQPVQMASSAPAFLPQLFGALTGQPRSAGPVETRTIMPSGPTMSVYRGTEQTAYSVTPLGGR
ncbi:MAG: Flp pilus assembly protein CpaB [Croceibacterium sp.]